MKRRSLIRFQIFLLVILALLVLARMIVGPPAPEGLVVFVDLDPFTGKQEAFELSHPAQVAIQATGSFGDEAGQLAAYSWIMRRADRSLVWSQQASASEHGRGNAAHIIDTLHLDAGIYDVYFAAYGNTFDAEHQRRPRWTNDARQWQFVLKPTDEAAPARLASLEHRDDHRAWMDGFDWTAAPLRNNTQQSHLFDVRQPTRLGVYAMGEISTMPVDYAWIEDAVTGQHVWAMTEANTQPAGGVPRNRSFRGEIALAPGVYRAVVTTNEKHAYGDWRGNPPHDLRAWGLSLAFEEEAVSLFDPWTAREPLISMIRVGDEEEHSRRFEVTEPVQVIAYGYGEMTNERSLYDYAELLKDEAGRREQIWRMSYNASEPAGGDRKNRMEMAVLRLEPGTYTLHYETDGSHSFDDWNADPPDYPERWGVTLFSMAPALDENVFRLLSDEAPPAPNPPPTAVEPSPIDSSALVNWTRLGQEVHKTETLRFDAPARLRIVALGEVSRGGQHDYGWIEQAETAEKVWEMSHDNTSPAGGSDRYRRFDGVITLPAGEYVVHFITDFSNHYGDFDHDGPDTPDAWGMVIQAVEEEAASRDAE